MRPTRILKGHPFYALLALFFATAILSPAPARAEIPVRDADRSEFKGYVEINTLITTRMMKPGNRFDLGPYLIDTSSGDDSLLALLGSYTSGVPGGYRNGRPNGVNMLLWYTAFSAFSKDVAALCDPTQPEHPWAKSVHPKFIEDLKPLCAWPQASAKTDAILFTYWTALMSFDPPYEEYEAWRDFFLGPDYMNAPNQEAIAAMTLAAWMNPYFLLR